MENFSRLDFNPALRSRRTTSDYVAEALRNAIFDGQFADGEELNQVKLADHFNVSRVPVREAIRQLQAEGLVSAEAHRRAAVVGLSLERIGEAFEVRAVLEDYLLTKSAPFLDEADFERLHALSDELVVIEDRREWLDKNREFHRVLHQRSGAKMALALVEQITLQVERYLQRAGGIERAAEVGTEHRAILEALERNDVHAARRALELHIRRTREGVVGQLRRSEINDGGSRA